MSLSSTLDYADDIGAELTAPFESRSPSSGPRERSALRIVAGILVVGTVGYLLFKFVQMAVDKSGKKIMQPIIDPQPFVPPPQGRETLRQDLAEGSCCRGARDGYQWMRDPFDE